MASLAVPTQKVILCGEYGVGKSSLFRRFAHDTFVASNDRRSTLGLDHYTRSYSVAPDHRQFKLQLWDTGGMERVASVTSSYYKFAEAAILVFALDNADSFNILSQHLLEVVNYAEHAKIYVCGNKLDLLHNVVVTDSDLQMFCEQCHSLVTATFRTSCRTGEGVHEMFSQIAEQLANAGRSRRALQSMDQLSFQVGPSRNRYSLSGVRGDQEGEEDTCSC